MESYPLYQMIDENGEWVNKSYEEEFNEEKVKEFYYHMLRIRTYDQKGVALPRKGRIGMCLFQGTKEHK